MQRRNAYLIAFGLWPLFLVVAIALGGVRETLLTPWLGDHWAHAVETLVFVVVILAIEWPFVRWIRGSVSNRDLWLIGLLWTSLTMAFEFLFFHYMAGVPWSDLWADYNILAGRLWPLVLLALLLGPRLWAAVLR